MASIRCAAKTAAGKKCKKNAIEGSQFCNIHDRILNRGEVDAADVLDLDSTSDGNETCDVKEDTTVMEEDDKVSSPHKKNVSQISDDSQTMNLEVLNERIQYLKLELKRLELLKKNLTTNGKVMTKAKWLFYHEHKANPQLLEDVRNKLRIAGLYMTRQVKINGDTIDKEIIPYTIIKCYTDNAFNGLIGASKASYITKAREMLSLNIVIPSDK